VETFKVAHIREQGVDLVITPLDTDFGFRTEAEQQRIAAVLQACARTAGLEGIVVPVWNHGDGRMAFLAPREFHPFFRRIDLSFVMANINRTLTCGF
jgi:sugar phosphate isomerase/epimerase